MHFFIILGKEMWLQNENVYWTSVKKKPLRSTYSLFCILLHEYGTWIQYFPKLLVQAWTVHVHVPCTIISSFDSYYNTCIFLPVWLYIFFLLYSRVKCLQRIHPLSKRSLLCWSPLLASPIQSQYLYWLPRLFLVILLSFSLQFLNCFPLFSTTEWRV